MQTDISALAVMKGRYSASESDDTSAVLIFLSAQIMQNDAYLA